MKTKLPETIADGTFVVIGRGETYEAKLATGAALFSTLMEVIYGPAWRTVATAAEQTDFWNDLSNTASWSESQDAGYTGWSTQLGEIEYVEIYRLTDPVLKTED